MWRMVTQADIDTLNRAIATGARSVTLRGQTIIYNTSDSLIRARNDMQTQLNRQNRTQPRSRQTYLFQDGRGFE